MSGGVDSSVTAALLLEQGFDVVGMTMHLKSDVGVAPEHGRDGGSGPAHDASRVAEQLGIPFHVVNFAEDFQAQIIAPFCEAYYAGRTPNPCALCNKKLKFGLLLEKALQLGADFLATGHYVNLARVEDRYLIRKGVDQKKDQSYFLFALSQLQLAHCLFPLGGMNKNQVRAKAAEFGLPVAEKSESQDICFIPDGEYIKFLEKQCGDGRHSGEIIHVSGTVLGSHRGVHRYTVGQRKGLGIGWTEPLYVVSIDARAKKVIVGERDYLSQRELLAADCHWSIPQPQDDFRAACRIRYRHREMPARIVPLPDNQVRVVFDEPQFGITPGQAAVFYADDLVIGGGWIQ